MRRPVPDLSSVLLVTALAAQVEHSGLTPTCRRAPRSISRPVGLLDEGAARDSRPTFTASSSAPTSSSWSRFCPASGNLEDYVNRLYEHWRIGQRETQRGVLFVVFPEQRKTRIEVGYGLEENLPDITAGRILKNMLKIPGRPADKRFDYVIGQVAAAVAPDDPLAKGVKPLKVRSFDEEFPQALVIGLIVF